MKHKRRRKAREETGSQPQASAGDSDREESVRRADRPEGEPSEGGSGAPAAEGLEIFAPQGLESEQGLENEPATADAVDLLWESLLVPADPPAPDDRDKCVGDEPRWQLHDFRRPRPLVEPQIQALDTIHCRFARSLSAALSVLVRSRVHVDLVSVNQRSYFDFIRSLANPTSLHVVYAQPQQAPLVLEIGLSVLFPMIERVLGGNGDGLRQPSRPLTRIEQRLAGRIVERILGLLTETWDQGPELRLDLAESEHNPLLMQIVGPSEPTLVLAFEITTGFQSGPLHLALPLKPLDLLISRLIRAAGAGKTPAGGNSYERARLLRRLGSSPITLTAELPSIPIRMQDLLTLRPGDMIDTQIPRGSEAIIRLEGQRLFRGVPTQDDERSVVKISRLDRE
jgi:flagellar motor switch protein FliM